MSSRILPELTCHLCGHTGNDYKIRIVGQHQHNDARCAKCGQHIKFLSKEDKYGTKEQQLAVWKKTNGRCAYCGKTLNPFDKRGYTYDHIEAQINGGGNEADNLVPCCLTCNTQKRARTVEDYREYLRTKNGRPKWIFYFEVLECSSLGEYLKVMF